ncbi:RdgB/HAM1 family non-canonical purine NTP pyrophosphatase [Miltoncostaea marina]|uniref:RdgB/HAM1 family non-canonical purine NTP pyrophosphatase n=1 Tax=Miltoncostaea marina TaxID=2843215 RepID=UPI001C3E1730|nr:RdgB/HAM1 family non-canonical purine NTP pyrophosphatase [Miltoncostaea marina]
MRVVLATGNADKVAELRPLLAPREVAAAPEGFDVEETGVTLFQNAWLKARALRERIDDDSVVLADDTGLVVHALGGRPGVFSARYAGPDATYADNCRRLLEELEGVDDRAAAFVCVLVGLRADGSMLVASGSCPGRIAPAMRGAGGFGYDPVFLPEGEDRSMAEMTREEKAAISHRGRAARRMAALLDEPA